MELLFLSIGLIAVLGDFFIPLILGKKYPKYSSLKDTISTLGTKKSPVKKQLAYWLIILGILLLTFSIGHMFVFLIYTWKEILYILGIIIFGVGCILSGIFEEIPKGSEETLSGKIHGISSGLGFLFLIFNSLWMFFIAENIELKIFNICCFILGFLTFIIFLVSNKRDGLTGLWQRINLATIYLPLILNYIILTF